MNGRGKRYSTLPSSSDVPPSGRGVNLSSPTSARSPVESRAVFGSQSRIAGLFASQSPPLAVRA